MRIKNFKINAVLIVLAALVAPNFALANPSNNQIKSWIVTNKVLLERRKLLPDKYQELEISKISNLKNISMAKDHGLMSSNALIKVSFDYDYNGGTPCDASITYTWTTLKSNYQLQNVIATCAK